MPALKPEMNLRSPRRSDERQSGIWDQGLFWALLTVVALAPLPLGSNRPLPAAILCLSAGLLLVLWALRNLGGGQMPVAPRRIWLPLLLYSLTCAWIFIQWLPLGVGDPMWGIAARMTEAPLHSRITINPQATMTGLMRILTYGAVFWLSLQLSRHNERAERGIRTIAIVGGIYALYGLVTFLSGNETLLFYRRWAYPNALTSSFVNRNSYATFAGLCLLATTLILLTQIRQTLSLSWPLKLRMSRLIEQLFVDYGWLSAAFLLSLIALMLTGSRAGIASTAAGLIVLGLFFLRGRAISLRNLVAIGFIICLIGSLAWQLGSQTLRDRYSGDHVEVSGAMRLEIYAMSLSAIASAPWTGTGFGSFADAITAYRTEAITPLSRVDMAHSVYLDNAVELGIPATISLNLAIALIAYRCFKGALVRQRNWALPALGVAATLLVAIHSAVDFSLQIPAVSVLYAFIMGMACSQSWSHATARSSAVPVSDA